MKNLDQIRACNALAAVDEILRDGENEGSAISGYPSLIINNGLMAALAFSIEKKGQHLDQHLDIANAIANHLISMEEHSFITLDSPSGQTLLKKLSESDSSLLQLCTGEALAFLSFLKRFART